MPRRPERVQVQTDPLGFALAALNAAGTCGGDGDGGGLAGAAGAVHAGRRAWSVLDADMLPGLTTAAAEALALGVRRLVFAGQPLARATAVDAVAAADLLVQRTNDADRAARAVRLEARGAAQRAAISNDAPRAAAVRALEASALDLLTAVQLRAAAGETLASARTSLEIAETLARLPADDRGPVIERAVGHARRALRDLTPQVDPAAHARGQTLLSGLVLDHPSSDPRRLAPAAARLAQAALDALDHGASPWVAARAWRARGRALDLMDDPSADACFARAAELEAAADAASDAPTQRLPERPA